MQGTRQKLPIVDGFFAVEDQPLSRYERAFTSFRSILFPDAPGATTIRVTAKNHGLYADRDPSNLVTRSCHRMQA